MNITLFQFLLVRLKVMWKDSDIVSKWGFQFLLVRLKDN